MVWIINHDDRPLWIQKMKNSAQTVVTPRRTQVVYRVFLQKSSLRFRYNKPHLLRYGIFLEVIEAVDSSAARVRSCMWLLYSVLVIF